MRQRTDVPIIGVPNGGEGTDADKRAFIEAMTTAIPHVLERPEDLWRSFNVTSQPTMVFVAADGSFERSVGAAGPQRLLDRVRQLADAG